MVVAKGWLFDTCLLSEIRKKRVNPGVVAWFSGIQAERSFVSVATLAELDVGVVKLLAQNDSQAAILQAWVENIKQRFARNTLGVDDVTWTHWSHWQGQSLAKGHARPAMDGLLVATAQQYGLTIVTRNVRDFAPYPHIHNPWTASTAA
jgi:predicted nucleic acid-binding protein